MLSRQLAGAIVVLCMTDAAVSAEALQMRRDVEGNVHFGTSTNPNFCCMCQPALGYESQRGRTKFVLRYGIERVIANERVFLSEDGQAWYCEGIREMGRASRKCGLIEPLM